MIIGSTLPGHNINPFQARRPSFACRAASLIAANQPSSLTRTPSTRTHLSNLDKLLRTQTPIAVDNNSPNPHPEPPSRNRAPLEGLNLPRIWPEMKAAEDMSPRNLNRLQRLLSMTEQRSPRESLGGRWREYHGSDDWSGLLDPLDVNLRRELVRYGEFVQAAYHAFHSDPEMSASAAEDPPSHRVSLPDRAYRVTKSLYATASVGLPGWVDDMAPDLGWMTQRSSWVGYVAVCEDRREIARMGRRDIVIALRGTATCLEWAENLRNVLVPLPTEESQAQSQSQSQSQPKVECGFLSLHKTQGAQVPSLAQSVVDEVHRLVDLYKGESLSISVTGHSLGAALAVLVADELTTTKAATTALPPPPVAVYSFGGPRVGNRSFANRIGAKNVKVLRVVNSQDVITRMPGMLVSEGVDERLREVGVPDRVLDDWAYWHVGAELRVHTKMSPYLKPDADVSCCHDLEAYLHLVDGFLASNCPFRENAKRSLVKLLHEQGSNVKKLYTSKAKALTARVDQHARDVDQQRRVFLHQRVNL